MEQDLISKKDLLVQAGISYGQLYRWKRKGLIPEDWFVRKSTFTGQETFFPRDKMLARIERILAMKEGDLSLDDIADAVSPDLADVAIEVTDAVDRGVVTEASLEALAEVRSADEPLRFGELLAAAVSDSLLERGVASVEESKLIVKVLAEGYQKFEGRECDLVFVRKKGLATALLVNSSADVVFESGTKIVARERLQGYIDGMQSRLA